MKKVNAVVFTELPFWLKQTQNACLLIRPTGTHIIGTTA
uniref:Uncharacterized protein n=1 Tax=Anguilla anguilla TaxID=7936 RepID=A0A0E9WEM7_ANGAN